MQLSELLNNLPVVQIVGRPDELEIENITSDSRAVKERSLFVAVKGLTTDGHKFIQEAVSKGASAVIIDNDNLPDQFFLRSGCVKILVKESRDALARISDLFFGKPSSKMRLIGITGTKGKTTSTFFIKNVLEQSGNKTGLIGTINNYIGDEILYTKFTTPEAEKVNNLLAEMVEKGCSHTVMEVSSHALEMKRVAYLDFDIAVFTNITSDHLDFHHSFENYLKAKKKLFDELKPDAKILYNIDDKNYSSLIGGARNAKFSYGMNNDSDFRIFDINFDLNGTEFKLEYEEVVYNLKTTLIGKFNAYNAAAAFAAGVLLGLNPKTIASAIEFTPQVPGRFEVISRGEKKVIIDYSHTADSLEQALQALNDIRKDDRKIYTVFGCGGDRDKFKRPVMGEIAERLSDVVCVTSDNPRTEDPFDIIADIKKGFKKNDYKEIEEREAAIKTAICDSEENAVILIAGKGHETYQEINGVRHHFSDKEKAEEYLRKCQN